MREEDLSRRSIEKIFEMQVANALLPEQVSKSCMCSSCMRQASVWKTRCIVDVREKKQRWKRKRKTKKVQGVEVLEVLKVERGSRGRGVELELR